MNQSPTLSLEQEFNLKLFAEQVKNFTPQQAKEGLVQLNQEMMIKDNLYRDLLKHYMGISSTPIPVQDLDSQS